MHEKIKMLLCYEAKATAPQHTQSNRESTKLSVRNRPDPAVIHCHPKQRPRRITQRSAAGIISVYLMPCTPATEDNTSVIRWNRLFLRIVDWNITIIMIGLPTKHRRCTFKITMVTQPQSSYASSPKINNSSERSGDDIALPPEQIVCRKQACAIQYCLNRFNHQEKKCRAFVEEWKRCRDQARQVAGWTEPTK
jgi:hypothetical protein